MSRLVRRLSRLHKIVGLVIGLQLLFWTLSGFYFTLFPIDVIRGDPWRPTIEHGTLDGMSVKVDAASAAAQVDGVWLSAELRPFLDRPVWLITTDTTRARTRRPATALTTPSEEPPECASVGMTTALSAIT